MPRPKKIRYTRCRPNALYYKPRGVPLIQLQEVCLSLDELEAIRLADYKRLYHEQAAERMHISRPTFGRILEVAHRKLAETLIEGKALRIETKTENGG